MAAVECGGCIQLKVASCGAPYAWARPFTGPAWRYRPPAPVDGFPRRQAQFRNSSIEGSPANQPSAMAVSGSGPAHKPRQLSARSPSFTRATLSPFITTIDRLAAPRPANHNQRRSSSRSIVSLDATCARLWSRQHHCLLDCLFILHLPPCPPGPRHWLRTQT